MQSYLCALNLRVQEHLKQRKAKHDWLKLLCPSVLLALQQGVILYHVIINCKGPMCAGETFVYPTEVTKLKLLTLISEFLVSFTELQFHMGGMISSLAEGIFCLEQDLFDQNSECSSAVMIQTWKEESILVKNQLSGVQLLAHRAYCRECTKNETFHVRIGFCVGCRQNSSSLEWQGEGKHGWQSKAWGKTVNRKPL